MKKKIIALGAVLVLVIGLFVFKNFFVKNKDENTSNNTVTENQNKNTDSKKESSTNNDSSKKEEAKNTYYFKFSFFIAFRHFISINKF